MNCPSCGKNITWSQKWNFVSGLCSRKLSSCPHCGIKLISAKWPHWVLNIGSILMIIGVSSKFFFPLSISPVPLFEIVIILAAILMIPGLIMSKLEIANETHA